MSLKYTVASNEYGLNVLRITFDDCEMVELDLADFYKDQSDMFNLYNQINEYVQTLPLYTQKEIYDEFYKVYSQEYRQNYADANYIIKLENKIAKVSELLNYENFKLWMSSNGFDQAGSVCKFQPLSGADQASPSETENYVADGVVSSYTWATLDEAEPAAQNVFPSDEGSSMALSTASDDAVMWAMHLAIASGETTGTYKGATEGYELQFSFKYAYS